MFLFDFQSFISEIRENPYKKGIIEKYESVVEPIDGKDLKDLRFYKDYYSKIKVIPYCLPEDLIEEFDWDLLAKLVIGSFSSDYSYGSDENERQIPEFIISVKSGNQSATKTISELWSFQILRLYEIYVEEAINLQSLNEEDENESRTVETERKQRLSKWYKHYNKLACKYGNSEINKIKSELDKYIDL